MRPEVKICGITNLIDAKNALNLGADYIGFVNITQSPRYITGEEIEDIFKSFSEEERRKSVLLTNEESIDSIISLSSRLSIKIVQPYANLTSSDLGKLRLLGYQVFKPIQVSSEDDVAEIEQYREYTDLIILDAKSSNKEIMGGSGEVFDWDIFLKAKELTTHKLGLSGGLNPENIEQALNKAEPALIDLSSGLESKPGMKSFDKMKSLFENINAVACS